MTAIPLPLRQSIRHAWIDLLRATPVAQQCDRTLRVGSRFCATGLFADLCVRNLEAFAWSDISEIEEEREESPGGEEEPLYALRRVGQGGIDIRGLPDELRWMLGITDMQERQISCMNDDGLTFPEIADQLVRFFGIEERPGETTSSEARPSPTPWAIIQHLLPKRDRNPDRQASTSESFHHETLPGHELSTSLRSSSPPSHPDHRVQQPVEAERAGRSHRDHGGKPVGD